MNIPGPTQGTNCELTQGYLFRYCANPSQERSRVTAQCLATAPSGSSATRKLSGPEPGRESSQLALNRHYTTYRQPASPGVNECNRLTRLFTLRVLVISI
jgi:hypothetical protein